MEPITGVMIDLLVYTGDILVGKGWMIIYNGKNYEPTLIASDGSELEPGIYMLVPTNHYLVVINRTVQ